MVASYQGYHILSFYLPFSILNSIKFDISFLLIKLSKLWLPLLRGCCFNEFARLFCILLAIFYLIFSVLLFYSLFFLKYTNGESLFYPLQWNCSSCLENLVFVGIFGEYIEVFLFFSRFYYSFYLQSLVVKLVWWPLNSIFKIVKKKNLSVFLTQ